MTVQSSGRLLLLVMPNGSRRYVDVLKSSSLAVKAEPLGFADRWGTPPGSSGVSGSSYGTYVTTAVAQVGWEDLQATSGGALNLGALTYNDNNTKSSTSLSQMMSTVSAAGGKIRLRVMCGIRAPGWAKAIGGTALPWYDGRSTAGGAGSGSAYTIGRWWHTGYQAAYASLQTALAALLDANPVIADVCINGAMTVFDEPCIRQTNDPTSFTPNNRATLLGTSGESQPYSKTADIAAIQASIDAHTVWKQTHSSLSVNAYQYVVSLTSAPSSDTATTLSLMDYAHTSLGRLASYGNHSLRDNQQAWNVATSSGPGGDMIAYNRDLINNIYPKMASLQAAGCPIWFQTDAPVRLGRFASVSPAPLTTVSIDYSDGRGAQSVLGGPALDLALHFSGCGVEVPRNYDPGSVTNSSYPAAAKFANTSQAAAYVSALSSYSA